MGNGTQVSSMQNLNFTPACLTSIGMIFGGQGDYKVLGRDSGHGHKELQTFDTTEVEACMYSQC